MRELTPVAHTLIILALALWTSTTLADFDAGVAAYNRGDYATAFREFTSQAKQGDATAQYNLAVLYDNGLGVTQDYREAVRWYRAAAEQEYAFAQFSLGSMYEKGVGVARDFVEAHKWFNLAALQGHAYARANKDLVASQMTPAQIARAQDAARDFRVRRADDATPPDTAPASPSPMLVRSIQTNLNDLGYDPGPADGISGRRTRAAIQAFQRANGIAPDGVISTSLQVLLQAAVSHRPSRK